MNDIFESLALEAGTTGNQQVWFTRQELKKFYKLVVQECAEKVIADSRKYPETDLTWICAMTEASEVIKYQMFINGLTK